MAIVKSQRQETTDTSTERALTGSMLFPDLVWAHWAWQCRVRVRMRSRARAVLGDSWPGAA
jgi:hypothetical protein